MDAAARGVSPATTPGSRGERPGPGRRLWAWSASGLPQVRPGWLAVPARPARAAVRPPGMGSAHDRIVIGCGYPAGPRRASRRAPPGRALQM